MALEVLNKELHIQMLKYKSKTMIIHAYYIICSDTQKVFIEINLPLIH